MKTLEPRLEAIRQDRTELQRIAESPGYRVGSELQRMVREVEDELVEIGKVDPMQ